MLTVPARTAWIGAATIAGTGFALCTGAMILLFAEVRVSGLAIIGCGTLYIFGLGALLYLLLKFLGVTK